MNKKPKLLVILGPTATGKSDLAVTLALTFNGEVISADSRQVYKGLNLGTGKITKREMRGVPHHLLDVASPKTIYTVSRFQTEAQRAITDIISRGRLPIICGGTGFYIQAVVDDIVFPDVPVNKKFRTSLSKRSAEKLYTQLKKLDPKRARSLDPHNKVRLIRSIEIATALGAVPPLKRKNPYNALQIGLDIKDNILKEKIHIRILSRIKKGMIREASALHEKGLTYKRMRELGLEYGFLADHLEKKITRQQLIDGLSLAIFQYVKRQRKWFARDERIQWYKPTDIQKIQKSASNFLGICI